ncbi:uncharacterized protein [Periplaneta americana]|uniref:uncharacterized protein n=1 Tax=Periplaneta americana TaxID=6978 RepID=UPI0037E7BC72
MKYKQERNKHVSVHSSLQSASGPRPVVKVMKHFETVVKLDNKSSQGDISTAMPKVVTNLPEVTPYDAGEDEAEVSQLAKKKSNLRKGETKRKRKSTAIVEPVQDSTNKSSIKPLETISENPFHTSRAKNPLECYVPSTAKQGSDNPSSILHSDAALEKKITSSLETAKLYENKPLLPFFTRDKSLNQNTSEPLTLTESTICRFLRSHYDSSLYTDFPAVAEKDVHVVVDENQNVNISDLTASEYLPFCSHTSYPYTNQTRIYEISKYTENNERHYGKHYNAPSAMEHTMNSSVLHDGYSTKNEERVRRVKEIQLELINWKQTHSDAYTQKEIEYDASKTRRHTPRLRMEKNDCTELHKNVLQLDDIKSGDTSPLCNQQDQEVTSATRNNPSPEHQRQSSSSLTTQNHAAATTSFQQQ